MFKNVLIAEDHQSLKISVDHTLKELGVLFTKYAYYCDDAVLELKDGIRKGRPFELMITDLSFEADGREQKLGHGNALIEAVRDLQPDIKILVFSAESNPTVVNGLFQKLAIDGYVCKGRRDSIDLKAAVENLYRGKQFVSDNFRASVRHKNAHDFTTYDTTVISQLAHGTLQKDIPAYLQQQGLKAASLSSVEKRLNQIKEALGFTKNEQLVAYCKDHKVI